MTTCEQTKWSIELLVLRKLVADWCTLYTVNIQHWDSIHKQDTFNGDVMQNASFSEFNVNIFFTKWNSIISSTDRSFLRDTLTAAQMIQHYAAETNEWVCRSCVLFFSSAIQLDAVLFIQLLLYVSLKNIILEREETIMKQKNSYNDHWELSFYADKSFRLARFYRNEASQSSFNKFATSLSMCSTSTATFCTEHWKFVDWLRFYDKIELFRCINNWNQPEKRLRNVYIHFTLRVRVIRYKVDR